MDALVLAGGAGTRLRPLTDTRPKPLLPFCGEPFAAGLLRRLAAAGVSRVTFLVGADPEPYGVLHATGDALGVAVEAVPEDAPLDTAGAVRRLLRERPGPSVLVCNGDILTDLDLAALVRAHEAAGAAATLALTRVADPSAFGAVVCRPDGRIVRFVEKPPPGTLAVDTVNAGTYVLDPAVFDGFPGDGPLSFERVVFPGLLERDGALFGHVVEGCWADLGTPDRYLAGTAAVLEGRCAWPVAPAMRPAGRAALVHESAVLEAGVALGPGTVVGARCTVARGTRVERTVLFGGAHVGEGAHLTDCIIGADAVVPPGCRLAGAVLADGARA